MSSKNIRNAARLMARASLHTDLENAEAKVKRLEKALKNAETELKNAESEVKRLKKEIEKSDAEAGEEQQTAAATLDPSKIYERHNSRFRG